MDGLHVTQTDYQRVTPVDDASLYSAIGDYSITPLSFTSTGYNAMTIGAFKAVIAGRLVELESDFTVTLPSNLYGVLMYYTWDLSKVNTIDEATGVVTDNQNAIKAFPLSYTTIPQDTVNPSAPKGQRLIGGYINSSALSLPMSWGSDYVRTIRPYRETHEYSADYLIAGNNTVRCTRVGNVASMNIDAGKIGTAITSPATTLFYIPDLDMHPTVNPVVSPASFGYQWWGTDIRVHPAFMGSTSVQPACVLLGYAFSVKGTQSTSNPIPAGHNFVWGVSYAVKPPIDALSATLGFAQDSTIVDQDVQLYGRNLWIMSKAVSGYLKAATGLPSLTGNTPDAVIPNPITIPASAKTLVMTIYNPNEVVNNVNTAKPSFFNGSTYLGVQTPFNLTGDAVQTVKWDIPLGATKAYLATLLGAAGAEKFDSSISVKYEFNVVTPWTPAPEDVI